MNTTEFDPVDALIAEYIEQVESGAVPDRAALLADHPQLAERLRAFFADFDRLDRQAGEFHLSKDPNVTTDGSGAGVELPRIRYFGDYELLEVIAHGGMGVVYKARQVSLNRIVALKMLLKGDLATERDAARFQAEAEAAAALDHPNIVPIHEIGVHEGRQYYSMKYVEGGSLAKLPRSDARSEAARVATISRAVHFAHQRGVLHRDIKPGNVLLGALSTDYADLSAAKSAQPRVPFVTDFGLAKRFDSEHSLSESGAVLGTPRYMAPEQAAGKKDLTVAADVYSLGVVLYERLTGATPFTGNTALEVLRQLRENSPPRPSSILPGLHRDLETVCLKCLDKEPTKRYATAEALADDLDRWQRGEPIQARPVGRVERAWRWCARNPALAIACSVAVVALFVAKGLAIYVAVTQSHSAARLATALDESEQSRRQAQEYAATSALQRAKTLQGEGKREESLLWLARSLELAPREATELQTEVRQLATDWGQELMPAGSEIAHDAPINSVAYSPDERFIVTASQDKTARIWDVKTRKLLHTLTGHEDAVVTAGFSPDGTLIFTGSTDNTAKLWDAMTGQLRVTMSCKDEPSKVTRCRFSPDGQTMVTIVGRSFFSTRGAARLWRVSDGNSISPWLHHDGTLVNAIFSPDGKSLWSWGKDKTVRCWNAANGESLPPLHHFADAADWHSSFAFSPDGHSFLYGSKLGTATVYDYRSGHLTPTVIQVTHGTPVRGVAFAKGGGQFVTAGDSNVKLWDTITGSAMDVSKWSAGQTIMYYGRYPGQLLVHESKGGETAYDATDSERLVGWRFDDPVSSATGRPASVQSMLMVLRSDKSVTFQQTDPMDVSPAHLTLWAQVTSCQWLNADGKVEDLAQQEWEQRQRRLGELVQNNGWTGLAAAPTRDSLFWVRRQATACEKKEAWAQALVHLKFLVEAEPTWQHFDRRALAFIGLGMYDQAAASFAEGSRCDKATEQRDDHTWYGIGVVSLYNGDLPGYQHACRVLLNRYVKQTNSPRYTGRLELVADLHLLSQNHGNNLTQVRRDMEAAQRDRQQPHELLLQQLALSFRADASVRMDALAQSSFSTVPKAWLLYVIAVQRQGDSTEAKKWLDKSIEWMTKQEREDDPRLEWPQVLELRILRREAEGALNKPAAGPGKDQ